MKRTIFFAVSASLALLMACAPAAAPSPTAAPAAPVATVAPAQVAPTVAATSAPAPTAAPSATKAPDPTRVAEPTKAPPTVAPTAMDHGATTDTVKVEPTASPKPAQPVATQAPPAQGRQVTINISLFQFQPSLIEVPVGTTVTWINGDLIDHSVTQGNTPGTPGGVWDSGFFTRGKSFSFKFDKPGEFKYFCARHNSMTGMVRVVG